MESTSAPPSSQPPSNTGTMQTGRAFSMPNADGLHNRRFMRAYSLTEAAIFGQVMARITQAIQTKDEASYIKENFYKRECVHFVPSPSDETLCQCGRLCRYHTDESEDVEGGDEWKPETHTKALKTDAYGDLEFQGPLTATRAKYVRLAHDTPAEDVLNLLTDLWGLKVPKLLIEVTGGAKDFVLQPKLKRIFSKGIIRVAVSTDAWILTGGTHTGVMRHVGRAVREHTLRSRQKITAIGVVSWGIVDNREDLIETRSEVSTVQRIKHYRLTSSDRGSGASLDPNHTHFILVDDGSVGHYGVEISLRSKLEKLISSKKIDATSDRGVPAVCVALEGGLNTIRVVLENVTHDPPIPVVIAEGSGRAADLIAYAYRHSSSKTGQMSPEAQEQLKKKICETFPREKNICNKILQELLEVVRQRNMITIFSVEAENNVDIDSAILSALLKASNLSAPDQLKLSLIWNRVDFAKEHIFKNVRRWEESALEEAMYIALKMDRVGFVKLLLERGLYMQKFLTRERLVSLYNTLEVDPFPGLALLSRHANINNGHSRRSRRCEKSEAKITLNDVGRIIEHLLGKGFESNYTKHSNHSTSSCVTITRNPCCEGEPETAYLHDDNLFPYNDLFLWSVLTKKYNMAYLMWQLGRESLPKALIGFRLFYSLARLARSKYNTDAADRLTEQSRLYEQLAVSLLTQCFEEDAKYTRLLLCAELGNWSRMTCLSLAANFKHSRFIAHPSIQLLLNDHWYGQLKAIPGLKAFFQWLLCTNDDVDDDVGHEYRVTSRRNTRQYSTADLSEPTSPKVLYEPGRNIIRFSLGSEDKGGGGGSGVSQATRNRRRSPFHLSTDDRQESYPEKVRIIFTAPIVKFWINAMFYFLFLIAFTYVVLMELKPEVPYVEWFVVVTVFSLATEEIRQLVMQGDSEILTFRQQCRMWASDRWNLWDLVGIITFSIGFVLRLWERNLDLGRVFYTLDIMVWYVRILDILSVNKLMGPYVNMIGRMMNDTAKFIVILFVFLISYGVASRALMSPMKEWDWNVLRDVVYTPYWQIYGELFIDESDPFIHNCSLFPGGGLETCHVGIVLERLIMGIYLLIANVLLINMLIAIFNNTFQRVQENANEIWKFQRYRLIMEFSERPFLPPPFILIVHVYLVVKKVMTSCYRHRRTKPVSEMKIQLDDHTLQLLYNFMEDIVENHLREENLTDQQSISGTIEQISERVDAFATRSEEQSRYDNENRRKLDQLTERMTNLEKAVYNFITHH